MRKICLSACVAFAAVCGLSAQQVPSRIAGLEQNEEYMSLLREDARLQMQEDSMLRTVTEVRQKFREDAANRESYGRQILALEEQVFGIRNAKGRLTDRISTIEQEWVVSNLNVPTVRVQLSSSALAEPISEKEKVRNLVFNPYFGRQLPAADHAALVQAQRREAAVVGYVDRYQANYRQIAELAGLYAAAQTEAEAVDIYQRYKTMQNLNTALSDSLAGAWGKLFDNKSYAYSYLLDKLGQDDLLSRYEQQLNQAARQLSEGRGRFASDVLADYGLRKRVLLDFETEVASLLQLDAARDSLRGVAAQLKKVNYELPRIDVAERFFIDYAPITFSSPVKYTASNPIPECRVFRLGTVYRVLLGSYPSKRPVNTFRGAYPLCYQFHDGKWSYYAGGFATQAEAAQALKQVKAKGFTRAEVVAWRDGVYLSATQMANGNVMYRVEISGAQTLSEPVKQAIAASASNHELSRMGEQIYAVGLFDDRAQAEKLAAAVRAADGALEIKMTEVFRNQE